MRYMAHSIWGGYISRFGPKPAGPRSMPTPVRTRLHYRHCPVVEMCGDYLVVKGFRRLSPEPVLTIRVVVVVDSMTKRRQDGSL